MATKSKNFKGIFFIKTLCVILSALCAGVLSFFCIFFYENAGYITDRTNSWSSPLPSFTQSEHMEKLLDSDLYFVSQILKNSDIQQELGALEAQKSEVVQMNLERYLDTKAQIIHDELYYVATNYDGTGYDLAEYAESGETTTLTTTVIDTQAKQETDAEIKETVTQLFVIDEHAPYNARYCQKLLNTVSGRDFLKYDYLVRREAFQEKEFKMNFYSLPGDFSLLDGYENRIYQYMDYTENEEAAKRSMENCFDSFLQFIRDEQKNQYSTAVGTLHSEPSNLRYLTVAENGEIFTNMPAKQRTSEAILSHENALICKDGKITAKGAFDTDMLRSSAGILFPDGNVYLYLEDTLLPGDKYDSAAAFYNLFTPFTPLTALLLCIAAILLLLVCAVCLLVLCGHKSGAEGIHLCFTDKVPVDLHFLFSGGACIALACTFYWVFIRILEMQYCWDGSGYYYSDSGARIEVKYIALGAMSLIAAVFTLLLLEWLTSMVRLKKAHESWLRHCILWKIPVLLWKGCKRVFAWIRRGCKKLKKGIVFLLGKPQKIRYTAVGVILAFLGAQLIVFLLCVADDRLELALFLFILLWLGFGVLCVWYLRMIDRIIDASCDRASLPVKGTESMPKHLKTLAENLTVTSHELDVAVADAVRNERTKAELITNVSHDLKTPLTSVISYVDLLKKCDITDKTAIGYLNILDEKSAKLKRLIEDLIEASKVNTGNVKLQIIPLNLSELAMQAVVEATPDFEKQELDIRFTQPDIPPVVFADGTKTYRVLENLLSNAKKYSARGSRVYVRIWDEAEYGVFEIKNVSREPLDLSPDELTERFVRGDRSRSEDGNGLGLSIAKQLCTLQGGSLDISIDGDLFKVTVRLPKSQSKSQ